MNRAYHSPSALGEKLQQLDALGAGHVVQATGKNVKKCHVYVVVRFFWYANGRAVVIAFADSWELCNW